MLILDNPTRSIKITQVIGSCSSGGAENFVKNLLVALKESGMDVDLWVMSRAKQVDPNDMDALDYEKKYIEYLSDYKIPVQFIEKRPKSDWAKTKRRLRFLWQEVGSDIVHSHLSSVTFHVCRALSRYKIPIIQTIHSNHIDYRFIQRFYLKRCCAKFVSISKSMVPILKEQIGLKEGQLCQIPNGVPLNVKALGDRPTKNTVEKIIAVGRLTAAKDYPTLLRSFLSLVNRLYKEGLPIPKLQVVGDGELKEELVRLTAELGLCDHVSWLGLRTDVKDLLTQADIFVMSSAWEGLSIAVLEALASGLPSVVTDAGGNREMVNNGENGFVVPVKDPFSLADALYRLVLDRELRETFSTAAREKTNSFSIKKCAIRHIALYKGVVSQQNGKNTR